MYGRSAFITNAFDHQRLNSAVGRTVAVS